MLGVVENPLHTPSDDVMQQVAEEMGVGRHVPPDAGRRVLRRRRPARRARPSPTRTSAAPGPTATPCIDCGECMTGCRHNAKNTLVKNYLYLAEQQGARVHPLTTVTRVRAAATAAATASTPAGPRPSCPGGRATEDVHRRARRLRGGLARHPAAAAPAEGRGRPAAAVRPARLPHPHQLRVDPRRDRARPVDRLQPGRRDHLVVPPRRAHPHRAGPLRQGLQLHVADADGADRRRRAAAALADLAEGDVDAARHRSATCTTSGTGRSGPSSRWSCRRSTTRSRRSAKKTPLGWRDVVAAGPRQAQPDLDPGRQRGRPPDGRG